MAKWACVGTGWFFATMFGAADFKPDTKPSVLIFLAAISIVLTLIGATSRD
jgi:hypothetical protein